MENTEFKKWIVEENILRNNKETQVLCNELKTIQETHDTKSGDVTRSLHQNAIDIAKNMNETKENDIKYATSKKNFLQEKKHLDDKKIVLEKTLECLSALHKKDMEKLALKFEKVKGCPLEKKKEESTSKKRIALTKSDTTPAAKKQKKSVEKPKKTKKDVPVQDTTPEATLFASESESELDLDVIHTQAV